MDSNLLCQCKQAYWWTYCPSYYKCQYSMRDACPWNLSIVKHDWLVEVVECNWIKDFFQYLWMQFSVQFHRLVFISLDQTKRQIIFWLTRQQEYFKENFTLKTHLHMVAISKPAQSLKYQDGWLDKLIKIFILQHLNSINISTWQSCLSTHKCFIYSCLHILQSLQVALEMLAFWHQLKIIALHCWRVIFVPSI